MFCVTRGTVQMAYSTGTRHFIFEGLSWIAAAGVIAYSVVNYDSLKRSVLAAAGVDPTALAARAKGQQQAEQPQPARSSPGTVELKLQRDGHFHAEAEINGRSMPVLVDTGASAVALSLEAAERAGIYLTPSDFKYIAHTANGETRVALTTIDSITIGDITVRNVKASVHQSGLGQNLLGMSFLSRLSSYAVRQGVLVLKD